MAYAFGVRTSRRANIRSIIGEEDALPTLIIGTTPSDRPALIIGTTPSERPALIIGTTPLVSDRPALMSGRTPSDRPALMRGTTPLLASFMRRIHIIKLGVGCSQKSCNQGEEEWERNVMSGYEGSLKGGSITRSTDMIGEEVRGRYTIDVIIITRQEKTHQQ